MTDPRPSWDATWIGVADVIARRSRCVNAQVGAVIVSSNGRVAATGFNGPAARMPVIGPCSNWCPRAMPGAEKGLNYDLCPAIHAEENALLYVDRSRVEGGTIYSSSATCMSCAKSISNSGIRRLVHRVTEADTHRHPDLVEGYLVRCGISVVRFVDALV